MENIGGTSRMLGASETPSHGRDAHRRATEVILLDSRPSAPHCLLQGPTWSRSLKSDSLMSVSERSAAEGPSPPRPEYDVVCIGLTGAGKTSLLSRLCSEVTDCIVPTTGFSIKAVPFQNAILNVKELGGAENIKKYWSRYYQGSQGVVFVLDSASSEEDLEVARAELHSALQHPQLCTLPFLILANHQDKPAARSVQEGHRRLGRSVVESKHPRDVHLSNGNFPHAEETQDERGPGCMCSKVGVIGYLWQVPLCPGVLPTGQESNSDSQILLERR
ncbi:hypothetical protein SKAU_G00012390 [Synaphobranchus kaupii]|uniref:ADP-ribosylation factor-like protein 15 n=1 Tax=Synaphobranchus kaupii TaxID=118154 RepID=A0A9Q1GAA8_SYNKA|nr:hypothetical protein SKAU_G00012390 [Synaphobranchus kaupii]